MMQHRKTIKPPPPTLLPSPINNPKQFQKYKFIFIAMAAFLSFVLLSILLFFTIPSTSRHNRITDSSGSPSTIIDAVCRASRDPSTCRAALSGSSNVPNYPTVLAALQSALGVSSGNLNTGKGMVQNILQASTSNQNRSNAAKNCLELLRYSEHRIALVTEALPNGKLKDARAWMSAALAYQYDCWSALKYVNDTSMVGKAMAFFASSVIGSSSDFLAMLVNYDVYGDKTGEWGPVKTERDGFWESGSKSSDSVITGGVPLGLKSDATVCNSGSSCDYQSVQQAVNAAPDNSANRFVIWIKAGVYEEIVRVPLEKKNVVFLGDGIGKTIITGSVNTGYQGVTTYNTATVGVVGDGFMAKDLTFRNTAGPDAHQAVAFRSDSDLSVVENCEFTGNQDTLYAHSLRQYYKSCRIVGNVDFIFGNSAAFFQDSLILVAPRQQRPEKGEANAVTAHGRIDPAQLTGFVFKNCVVNGTEAYMALYYKKPGVHKNFLGRPWKQYSRTVFIQCTFEVIIRPEGWKPWNGNFALETLYYGEFENTGPGSDTSSRVKWSSLIAPEHVGAYSVQSFIQGDQWIPTSS